MNYILRGETNLVGELRTDLLSNGTSCKAFFYSKNDPSVSRVPVAPLKLTLARGTPKQEEIVVSAVGMPDGDGIVVLTVSKRKLPVNLADMTGFASGFHHSEGTKIESVSGHFAENILEAFLNGVGATASGVSFEKDIEGNRSIFFDVGTENRPFVRMTSGGSFVYSNDGISSTPFGTGAGISASDGLSLVSGVMKILVEGTPLYFDGSGKLALKKTKVVGVDGEVVQVGTDGKIDPVLLANGITSTAFSGWGAETAKSPSASAVKAKIDEITGNIVAGDSVVASALTQQSHGNSTFTKKKEFRILQSGNWRCTFDLKANSSGWYGSAKIYKNGVDTGFLASTLGTTMQPKTYEGNFSANDTLEIWISCDLTVGVTISNAKVKAVYAPSPSSVEVVLD